MKASFFWKLFFILPLILFVDYIIMALLGCMTCLFGLGEDYYCSSYCIVGKIILAFSALLLGYLMYPDIKNYIISKKYGKATEAKED
jgi:hypothetical protein